MKHFLLKLFVKAQILRQDNGQDLIEYALVVALIALGAAAGMNSVASAVNAAFENVGTKIAAYSS